MNCAKCGVPADKLLRSERGEVCEECFVRIHQNDLPIDQYSLRPGEMTTTMAAYHMKVTRRSIQNWVKARKIACVMGRRRIGNEVKQITILMAHDLDNIRAEKDQETHLPAVSPQRAILATTNAGAGIPAEFMLELIARIENSNKPTLLQLTGKVFIDINELSKVTNLAVSVLRREIKAAEKAGTLQRFPGIKGKHVWKSNDLLQILAAVQPIDTDTIYANTHFGRGNNAAPDAPQTDRSATEASDSASRRETAESDGAQHPETGPAGGVAGKTGTGAAAGGNT